MVSSWQPVPGGVTAPQGFLASGIVAGLKPSGKPDLALLSYPVLVGNAMGGALFLLLGAMGHSRLLKLPGLYLMSLTALLGWLGVT